MNNKIQALYDNLTSCLLGAEKEAALLMTGILANGHVLIQGAPGTGKTSLAKIIALSIHAQFRRIQFTPDLLPTEILGYNIYNQTDGRFVFHKGPVFSHVILADEINRASPRTQSALLEAMNESQVTIDGVTYQLEKPFFVVATENHLSSTGTFPLPDSQLDRFLLSFNMPAPRPETKVEILELHSDGSVENNISAVMTGDELIELQNLVRHVHIRRNVMEYIVSLCTTMTEHDEFASYPSTRASIALMNAGKAHAFLKDRDSVYPDDIKAVLPYVFRHRVTLKTGTSRQEQRVEKILNEITKTTAVPVGE